MTEEDRLNKLRRLKQLREEYALKHVPMHLRTPPVPVVQSEPSRPLEEGVVGQINSALLGAGQALTMGAMDEMVDIPMAGYQSLTTGKPFSETYAKRRDAGEKTLRVMAEKYPAENLAGGVAASVASIPILAKTAIGKTFGGMLGSGSTAAQVGKGMLVGGATGGAAGALSAERGDRLEGAEMGAMIGAPLGGAGSALSATLRGNISDTTASLAKKAKDKFGIDLDLSQVTQSRVGKRMQDMSQNIPMSGSEGRRASQLSQYNKAVSQTFGQDISEFTQDAWEKAFKDAGKPFNDVLSGKVIDIKNNDLDDLFQILDEASGSIDTTRVPIIEKNIQNIIDTAKNGEITGEQLNQIRSSLSASSRTADPFVRPFISKILNKVVDISADGVPEAKETLNKARADYKNLNVALDAWDSTTNAINPVRLETSVKTLKGFGKRGYATGKAGDLGELAQIGKTFMGVPGGSSTVPNMLLAGGAGGALFDPTGNAAMLGGGVVAANRAAQELINRNPMLVNSVVNKQTLAPVYGGMLGGYMGNQYGGN